MSTDEAQEGKAPANWYLIGGVAGAVGLVLIALLFMGRTPTNTAQTTTPAESEDDLANARQLLLKESDQVTCRAALGAVNTHFSRFPQNRPPVLDRAGAESLRQQVPLAPDEVEEITGGTYTRLDAHHLEHCCLLRDAARWLDPRGQGGKADPSGLERAARAFDWVVRQVRTVGPGGSWVAPVMVLRRGWGTDLDRALIFLALLDQVGSPDGKQEHLHGCLLFLPNAPEKPRLWACGVVVGEGRDVYLFDPRLGMALPGPGGKGIATLADVRDSRKGAEILDQLADKDRRYDVTPEQARAAEAYLVCPLSGLAPRMKYLQDTVLAPAVEVHLAPDVSRALSRLQDAAGKETAVKIWPEGPGLLRRFLSTEEGGVDRPAPYPLQNLPGFSLPEDTTRVMLTRQLRFQFEQIPWKAFPEPFRNPHDFPNNSELGQKVRDDFVRPFRRGNLEGGQARDLLLRGLPGKAVTDLMSEHQHWREQRQRQVAADAKRFGAWVQRALAVYRSQVEARDPQAQQAVAQAIAQLWNDAEDVRILLGSGIAVPRLAEVTYQLALCKQEEAERLQARLDREAGKIGEAAHPADAEKTQATWRDALGWWKEFLDQYPNEPGQSAARRLRGRAQAMLGDWQGAVASWQILTRDMTEPEQLASLYRARQLVRQHEK